MKMKSGFDFYTLIGVAGTAGTLAVAYWSDIGAGIAGLGTGLYMVARAWHVWKKTQRDAAPPLCKNFAPTKTGTEK
jgi:hypothetical protein